MKKIGKQFWQDTVKSVLIALIISAILILGLTVLLGFIPLSDGVLVLINQIIKVISLLMACLLCFKEKSKGIPKGFLVGLLYALFSWLLFGLAENSFSFVLSDLIDIGFGAVLGILCGGISVVFGRKGEKHA